MINGLSVDLEDWYQGLTSTNPKLDAWPTFESRVVDNTIRLLDILAEHNVKATFFVLGSVAHDFPELIAEIQREGHEIGVHGYYHRMIHQQTRDEFAAEIDRTIATIAPIIDEPVIGHRAPYASINTESLWALGLLKERGFQYDSSVFPTKNMLYGSYSAPRFPYYPIASDSFVEFPLSTVSIVGLKIPIAGGFYLRTLPYWFIRWGIKRIHAEGQPAIMYMHPWELDLNQPRIGVTPRERITHYHGRASLEGKLHRLLQEFHFAPLKELLGMVKEVCNDEQGDLSQVEAYHRGSLQADWHNRAALGQHTKRDTA